MESIKPEEIVKILAEHGTKVTSEEAKIILEFCGNWPIWIEPDLDKALNVLGRLDQLYMEGDIKRKRAMIDSIYPKN